MRAMFLEFPDDRTTHYLDRQYMLGKEKYYTIVVRFLNLFCGTSGPNLLVVPIFVPVDEDAEYYLPAGRWTSFFHPERTVTGPKWVKERVPIDEIPVWVRPGSVLLLGPEGIGRPDYDYTQRLEVRAYGLEDGAKVTVDVPVGKGTDLAGQIKVQRVNGALSVEVDGGPQVANTWSN